ncbi:MAG: DUF2442 domain-containing protein [Cellulosilyticaceae bacterium]
MLDAIMEITEHMLLEVISAEYVGEYKLRVTFNNNVTKLCDFTKIINFTGVFSQLLDIAYFKQFYIEDGVLHWSEMLDCCPDTMYMKGELLCQ